jgi:hypothetical protein
LLRNGRSADRVRNLDYKKPATGNFIANNILLKFEKLPGKSIIERKNGQTRAGLMKFPSARMDGKTKFNFINFSI